MSSPSASVNSLDKPTQNTLAETVSELAFILLLRDELVASFLLQCFDGIFLLERAHSLLALLEASCLVGALLSELRSKINFLWFQ